MLQVRAQGQAMRDGTAPQLRAHRRRQHGGVQGHRRNDRPLGRREFPIVEIIAESDIIPPLHPLRMAVTELLRPERNREQEQQQESPPPGHRWAT